MLRQGATIKTGNFFNCGHFYDAIVFSQSRRRWEEIVRDFYHLMVITADLCSSFHLLVSVAVILVIWRDLQANHTRQKRKYFTSHEAAFLPSIVVSRISIKDYLEETFARSRNKNRRKWEKCNNFPPCMQKYQSVMQYPQCIYPVSRGNYAIAFLWRN